MNTSVSNMYDGANNRNNTYNTFYLPKIALIICRYVCVIL